MIELIIFLSMAVIILGLLLICLNQENKRLDYYQKDADKFYERWFNLHKYACEAWHISKEMYYKTQPSEEEIKEALDEVFYLLNYYYGDDDE